MKNISIFLLLTLFALPVFAQQGRQAQLQPAKYVKQVALDTDHKIVLTEKPAVGTALQFDISHLDQGSEAKTKQVFGPSFQLDYASRTATYRLPDQALANPELTLEKLNQRLANISTRLQKRAEMVQSGKLQNGKFLPANR